jgi:hypothetical protein
MGKQNLETSGNRIEKGINMNGKQITYYTSSQDSLEGLHKKTGPTKSQSNENLVIFHQNIRGLRKKANEILCHMLGKCPTFYVLRNTT